MPDICNAVSFSSSARSLDSSSATGECASALDLCANTMRSATKPETQAIKTQAAASNINARTNGDERGIGLFSHGARGSFASDDKADVSFQRFDVRRDAFDDARNHFVALRPNLSHHSERYFDFVGLGSHSGFSYLFCHEPKHYAGPSLFVTAKLKVQPSFPMECYRCVV